MNDISLSHRVQRIKPSPTLAVTARAAELRAAGKDIIGLGAGEPDFDTPQNVKDAASRALAEGQTKYSKPASGIPAAKQAVCTKLARENGLDYKPSQVIVTAGGKMACALAISVLVGVQPGVSPMTPASSHTTAATA